MMVTRRNAVSQVVGFMSLENGLILAAAGAKGMPLVVEISVAFSILIAFIVIGIFLFRIRERFDTVDVQATGPVSRGAPVTGFRNRCPGRSAASPDRGGRIARLVARICLLIPAERYRKPAHACGGCDVVVCPTACRAISSN